MSPENPGAATIDTDGRIKVGRGMIPGWLHGDSQSYCVPLLWKRDIGIPQGHELEAWIVWNAEMTATGWKTEPQQLMTSDLKDADEYALRTLMFPVKYDSKDRLCCAGLFNSLAKVVGRTVWVAPEMGSLSIWSNFAFQAVNGSLRVS
jgi:hypothetical protein